MLFWNPSTVILPLGGDHWRLFAPVARRNVLTNSVVLALIDNIQKGIDDEKLREVYASLQNPWAVPADEFRLWESPYLNADNYEVEAQEGVSISTDFEGFLEVFVDAGIFIAKRPAPSTFEKRSFTDRYRGSFYEQIGTEALFNREEPQVWWARQKFTDDQKTIRQTPYRYIEQQFLEGFFKDEMQDKSVLEIGCGTGFFSHMISAYAASVIGLDYNENYIEVACETWIDNSRRNLSYVVGNITDLENSAPTVAAREFDAVVLIDTFLFLFDPVYQPDLFAHRDTVMMSLARLLAEDGRLLIMDPHPFWLTPWIGDEGRPVGLISEYRNRSFKVAPTLEEISTLVFESGLRIRRIHEPNISPEYAAIDPTGYAFMREFPQWWFFEIERA